MAFKTFNINLIGTIKNLMTCCGGTVEFVGVIGILLLIAGTFQMGSGVYFMLSLPVFSVASNIWTGVVSGLTGTVLTYFGCSDQAQRRPYLLFTFCIVAIVANIANLVVIQVGDKTLNVFNEESFLRNMDEAKELTLKTGVWITTGATILSLASSFILANYLFCGQLKGRCETDKQPPLLKTISEEVLQKASRSKSKKGGSPNRFFPPSRLLHDSKVQNSKLNSVGLWIPWKAVESAQSTYSTENECSCGGRQSKDISLGGGSSMKHLNGEGVGLRNYYCRPNTLYRYGVVNFGATIDDESTLNDSGYSRSQNVETRTLERLEKTYISEGKGFSTFKPRRSRVAASRTSKLQGRDSSISVSQFDVEHASNVKEVNQKKHDEKGDVDIEIVERKDIVKEVVDQRPPANIGEVDSLFQNAETRTLERLEKTYISDGHRFSTFKPRRSGVAVSRTSKLQGRDSSISVSQKDAENATNVKEDNQKKLDEKGDAGKIVDDKIDVGKIDAGKRNVDIDVAERTHIVKEVVDQRPSAKIGGIDNESNKENPEDNLSSPNTQNDSESWMNVLPSVFTNIMEISDFNEFINNLITQDKNGSTGEKNSDQIEDNKIPKKQQQIQDEIPGEDIENKQRLEDSGKDLNNFRRSSLHRSKILKRPNYKPPLPPPQQEQGPKYKPPTPQQEATPLTTTNQKLE